MTRLAGWTLALACGLLAGCDGERFEHREEQTERFAAEGLERIDLRIDAGTIRLTATSGTEVEVRVDKRARAANRAAAEAAVSRLVVRSQQADGALRIEARALSVSRDGASRRARTDVEIAVPAGVSAIDVRTRDGSITIEDVSAELWAETGDGRIRASRLAGRATLRSEDGAITVHEAAGMLHASTADGSIEVDGALTGLDAATDDGSIRVECPKSPEAPFSLRSLDGSIRLTLGDDVAATLDASAAEGRIEHELESFRGTSRRQRRRGELRGGGHTILLIALDGNVRIRRR